MQKCRQSTQESDHLVVATTSSGNIAGRQRVMRVLPRNGCGQRERETMSYETSTPGTDMEFGRRKNKQEELVAREERETLTCESSSDRNSKERKDRSKL